jgi:predicted GNAT family N-acyltransferase
MPYEFLRLPLRPMLAGITIKQIHISDPEYLQVWALRQAVLRKPLGLSLLDEDLSGEAAEHILVAMLDGEVIGCVLLQPVTAHELKLRQMAVNPYHQGRGIGTAIVKAALALAHAEGYKVMTLHARSPAVPFYAKEGFAAEGELFTEVGIPHQAMIKQLV